VSKVYSLAKQARRVTPAGITETWWLEILAVGKKVKSLGFEVWIPANEYLSASLGTFLGLPIPPFAMLEKRTTQGVESSWFASLDYRLTGEDMPEIDPETVYGEVQDLCFGVLAFDLWIANTDRHVSNLSFDPTTSPKQAHAESSGAMS
jgi:hypothetical protein